MSFNFASASGIVSPSPSEKEFLGNGEWPTNSAAPIPKDSISIPLPPMEGIDNAPKTVYKMSARPRGIGNLINTIHFLQNPIPNT